MAQARCMRRFQRQKPIAYCNGLEIHYTPKHASWLNMVELEIGVLRGQCLDRRIGDRKKLTSEIATWVEQRNNARARIKMDVQYREGAQEVAHAYPDPVKQS
jgi:hypothetical protein